MFLKCFIFKKVEPQKCANSTMFCRNGGQCENIQTDSTSLFGYRCKCPDGYSGTLCEKSNAFYFNLT